MGAVGDAVEAMARAEHLEWIVLPDELPDLLDRREAMQVVGAVRELPAQLVSGTSCAAPAEEEPRMCDIAVPPTTTPTPVRNCRLLRSIAPPAADSRNGHSAIVNGQSSIAAGRPGTKPYNARTVEGQQLSHYTILAKIGEGGMGAVYRATDSRLNRTVAINRSSRPTPARTRTASGASSRKPSPPQG